jgi:hypothetical protein
MVLILSVYRSGQQTIIAEEEDDEERRRCEQDGESQLRVVSATCVVDSNE